MERSRSQDSNAALISVHSAIQTVRLEITQAQQAASSARSELQRERTLRVELEKKLMAAGLAK